MNARLVGMRDFNRIRADIKSSAATYNLKLNDAALPYSVWQPTGQGKYFPADPTSFSTRSTAQVKADQIPGQTVIFGFDSGSGRATVMIWEDGKCPEDGQFSWLGARQE